MRGLPQPETVGDFSSGGSSDYRKFITSGAEAKKNAGTHESQRAIRTTNELIAQHDATEPATVSLSISRPGDRCMEKLQGDVDHPPRAQSVTNLLIPFFLVTVDIYTTK